jgi:DNA-directed RNA polymerase specialized sigma24 family protein
VISDVLAGVQDLVVQLAHSLNRWNFDEEMLEDLVQQCMIHLWKQSLPRYDAQRHAKVSTFLHCCAFRYFYAYMLREHRRQAKQERTCPNECFDSIRANDESHDHKIEAIAEAVLANPEKFLTEQQVEVLRAVTNHPRLSKIEVSKMLGYRFPASLSQMLRKIRTTLTDLDIESYEVRP